MPAPKFITLKDALGREVMVMAGGNREGKPLSPERLQEIYDAQTRTYKTLNAVDRWMSLVVAHLVLGVFAVGLCFGFSYLVGGGALLAVMCIVLLGWGAAAFGVTRWLGRLDPRGYVQAMLERGLCPTCAYALSGLTGEKGTVRCPECGSHWRLADIGRRGTHPTSRP